MTKERAEGHSQPQGAVFSILTRTCLKQRKKAVVFLETPAPKEPYYGLS